LHVNVIKCNIGEIGINCSLVRWFPQIEKPITITLEVWTHLPTTTQITSMEMVLFALDQGDWLPKKSATPTFSYQWLTILDRPGYATHKVDA